MKSVSQIIVIVLALVLSACAGTRSAYQATAGDLDATAKVFTLHYTTIIDELNLMSSRGTLVGTNLRHAQDVVNRTSPVVEKMGTAAKAYKAVRSAENKLDLNRAISDAALAISALIDAFNQVGGDSAKTEHIEKQLDDILDDMQIAPLLS